MKPSTKVIIGIVLIFLIFNIIGRITERKVWSEPKVMPVPADIKINSPISNKSAQQLFEETHDIKG